MDKKQERTYVMQRKLADIGNVLTSPGTLKSARCKTVFQKAADTDRRYP